MTEHEYLVERYRQLLPQTKMLLMSDAQGLEFTRQMWAKQYWKERCREEQEADGA